ncbi:TetR/AcrR family transcriptional regulator [Streptomyces flaveolus]|uniref:TetR/AcrR family transcriptional regulator n=1 Tax=Streptomyces flaveolus TaxID=67297 RepID=UPI00342263DE
MTTLPPQPLGRPLLRDDSTGVEQIRRSDGERSYQAIVETAARLATTRGLDGLSLSYLAAHVGMSKSGLYAHFRSKEQLQMAAVEAAADLVDRAVLAPARSEADPLARLRTLCERYLFYVQQVPGGCFFSAAGTEQSTRPGAVRDRVVEHHRAWFETLKGFVEDAQRRGQLSGTEDPGQLAFEVSGLLRLGNDAYVMFRDPVFIERARTGIDHRLARAAVSREATNEAGVG